MPCQLLHFCPRVPMLKFLLSKKKRKENQFFCQSLQINSWFCECCPSCDCPLVSSLLRYRSIDLNYSYILHWKFNIVGTRYQWSKRFKQYSLVSGIQCGSICTWDRDCKALFGLESSWGCNINSNGDICFMIIKWPHHSRDFISWPKTSPVTSYCSIHWWRLFIVWAFLSKVGFGVDAV